MTKPLRLVITPGCPAGIGPDITTALAQHHHAAQCVVIADKDVLAKRAEQIGQPITIIDYAAEDRTPAPAGSIVVKHIPLDAECVPGQANPKHAPYILQTLETACHMCVSREADALVTGPVNKAVINDANIPFTGHTEFFANATNTDQVVMMLQAKQLRVALVTTHIPLASVSQAITAKRISDVVTILHNDLKTKFGLEKPRIFITGLNPHAGENGYLGREEIDVIEPAMLKLQQQGIDIQGPFPADTVFNPDKLADCDVVLAMYHDQGLPVLKHVGFGQAVNITLGLPIIRTSVDHGTAYALAGSGKANPGSLLAALESALFMANQNRNPS